MGGWPWGNELDDSKMPEFTSGNTLPLAEPVGGYPEGASWCGVEDLVGYVYQWTDVFTDLHTSRAVLRGAPRWRPHGRDMLGVGHRDRCTSRTRCFSCPIPTTGLVG